MTFSTDLIDDMKIVAITPLAKDIERRLKIYIDTAEKLKEEFEEMKKLKEEFEEMSKRVTKSLQARLRHYTRLDSDYEDSDKDSDEEEDSEECWDGCECWKNKPQLVLPTIDPPPYQPAMIEISQDLSRLHLKKAT